MNILYIMPRSNSDVLQSTAICKRIKNRFKNSKLYFVTSKEFSDLVVDYKWIDHVIEYNSPIFDNPEELNKFPQFDIVYTPHIHTQYIGSNWVHLGTGKNIIEEFAWHCNVYNGKKFKLTDFFVSKNTEFVTGINQKYILIVTNTSNKAETKHYKYWNELVNNLINNLPDDIKVVQSGLLTDEKLKNEKVIDFRGKTESIKDFNTVIGNAMLVISVDSYAMHSAYIQGIATVSIFGNTYPECSGPNYIDGVTSVVIDSQNDHKKCYKNRCLSDRNCINEINPQDIFNATCGLLELKDPTYIAEYPTLSGYTTIYNGINADIPFIESIQSMLPHCDEVVVVDGKSEDGTWEKLKETFKGNTKVKLYQRLYDFDIPGMDGNQKAYSRAFCTKEYCLQFDTDQIFEDGEQFKLKDLLRSFPPNQKLMHFLTIDLFGTINTIEKKEWYISRDYHMSRFALSKNLDEITHGINVHARVVDKDSGKIYSKPGLSDGAEYINVLTGEMIPHFGPWNQTIDQLRLTDEKTYSEIINKLYKDWPHFWHVSWCPIEKKIKHFVRFWDKQWNLLYNTKNKARWFEGVDSNDITKDMIKDEAEKLFKQGGNHLSEGEQLSLVKLDLTPPKELNNWFRNMVKIYG